VRQIRMLRAMRRELETELRLLLLGHEGGNPGHGQGDAYGFLRQLSTLPGAKIAMKVGLHRAREALSTFRRAGSTRGQR